MIINRQTPQRLIGAQLAAQGYIKPSKRSCPVLTDAIVDVQLLHCVLVVRRLQELVQIDIFQAVVAATVRDPVLPPGVVSERPSLAMEQSIISPNLYTIYYIHALTISAHSAFLSFSAL